MVEFHNPRKKDYKNSSRGFDNFIDKLNAQHPTKKIDVGDAYNYGMVTSVSDMRRMQRQRVHEQLNDIKKESKETMRQIKQKQKDIRRGKPEGFL